MENITMFKEKYNRKKFNILVVGLNYWTLLMFWQIIRLVDNHSFVDIFVKLSLIAYLIVASIITTFGSLKIKVSSILLLILVLFIQIISISINVNETSVPELLYYFFPVISYIIYFIVNQKKTVDISHLVKFLIGYVSIVSLLCFYNMVFLWRDFSSLFSIRQAYGSEMSSLLTSSHEYGMYLVYAIFSILLLLKLTNKYRGFYAFLILIFSLNLLSTISRTSIFSLLIGLLILLFISNKKRFMFVIFGLVILVFAIIFINPLNDYIYTVILKENNSAARDFLLSHAIDLYSQLPIINKIFGYGFNRTNIYLLENLGHNSFHNAYLNVLLFGGLAHLGLLIFLIIFIFKKTLVIYRLNKGIGSILISSAFTSFLLMATNTSIILTSPIDSFLLTIFALYIPLLLDINKQKSEGY